MRQRFQARGVKQRYFGGLRFRGEDVQTTRLCKRSLPMGGRSRAGRSAHVVWFLIEVNSNICLSCWLTVAEQTEHPGPWVPHP